MNNGRGEGANIIAIVGTGGSGKSTLANLLCGRYVLPMRVRGSAQVGFVINHNPLACSVTVRAGGQVIQGGDSEVRSQLEHLIEAAAGGPQAAGAGTVHLDLPMAVGPTQAFRAHWWRHQWLRARGYQIDTLGLPQENRLEIRDLPGYRYSGDRDRLRAILAGLDSAAVIAIFNAEEVDDRKEAEFASEIFRYCHDSRGGSPLVVLNRVDVFRRDHNPEREYQRRLDKLCGTLAASIHKIRSTLGPVPHIHTLSTLPVLAVEALLWGGSGLSGHDRTHLLEQASRFARFLVPLEVRNRLPRDPQGWSGHHLREYRASVCEHSSYTRFLATLREHLGGSRE
jgi:hypothetical protein